MSFSEETLLGTMIACFSIALWLMYRHFHPRTTARQRMEKATLRAQHAGLGPSSNTKPAPTTTGGSTTVVPKRVAEGYAPSFLMRIPFVGVTIDDFFFDLHKEVVGMKRRLKIKQIKFDVERWQREGEAIDPDADTYFKVPMRWWFLQWIGLGSPITAYVLVQDFMFNINRNIFRANQRFMAEEGHNFFDVHITDIANKVPGDPPGRLLERLGAKTVVITIKFGKPMTIPVLAAGLRWPDDYRDLSKGWVGGEVALLRILSYIEERVANGGPFTEFIVNPTPPAGPASQEAVPTPSAPQPTSQPAVPPSPGPSFAASSARPDPDVWLERRFG